VSGEIRNIVVIGSGNVAYHFIRAVTMQGIKVLQILGRNESGALALSDAFSVPYILKPELLDKQADLYILAVRDDQIREAALSLCLTEQLLVHTSGNSSLELLTGASSNTGVIWPLQTLTAWREITYDSIPFFIEGNTADNTEKLFSLAGLISNKVIRTDHSTRQYIHLAAVIAANFTNQLYTISASILELRNIPFDVLAPIIRETTAKALDQHPLHSQTGPAIRQDLLVIKKHLELLGENPEYAEIYRLITESIIQSHSKSK
jgi:predicted short-subunit dehydrogenase-like oxidoreductase (DUF2520 family)